MLTYAVKCSQVQSSVISHFAIWIRTFLLNYHRLFKQFRWSFVLWKHFPQRVPGNSYLILTISHFSLIYPIIKQLWYVSGNEDSEECYNRPYLWECFSLPPSATTFCLLACLSTCQSVYTCLFKKSVFLIYVLSFFFKMWMWIQVPLPENTISSLGQTHILSAVIILQQ